MLLCTPPPNSHIRKPKEKHFVIQLDYMIVYTHSFLLYLISNIHIFSFWFGKHLKRLIFLN